MSAEQGTVEGPDGKKLNKVEALKRAKDGLEVWDDIFRYGKNPNPRPLGEVVAGFTKPEAKEQWESFDRNDADLMMAVRRNGSIADDDLVRFRWYGMYQQLPNIGHFMLRIRIPNGFLTPIQFREIAAISEKYGRGFGDITTRQCIQLHWLTIDSFADILPRLEKSGVGDEVCLRGYAAKCRGVPDGRTLAAEIVDPTLAVRTVNDMFLKGNKEFSNFFFRGNLRHRLRDVIYICHQPQINDIGAFGVVRKHPVTGAEERGFGVIVGGGLSTQPYIGQSLRVFV